MVACVGAMAEELCRSSSLYPHAPPYLGYVFYIRVSFVQWLMLIHVVSGIVDAVLPAHSADSAQGNLESTYDSTRLLLSGDVWAIVICVASLLTSVTATSLIAYRAW